MKKALVFGATGLIGKELINQLIDDSNFSEIIVLARRKPEQEATKIRFFQTDFSEESLNSLDLQPDVIFSCFGTTMKKAKSKENFTAIDFQIPLNVAKRFENGSREWVLVSSIGANAKSSNFYLQSKGKLEEEILKLNYHKIFILRPSFLLGNREEFRLGEKIGIVFIKILGVILLGPLKKYKGIYDSQLSKAMRKMINNNLESGIYESDQLQDLSQ